MRYFYLLIFSLILLLSGCVGVSQPPLSAPHATIRGSGTHGLFNAAATQVTAIDGKDVGEYVSNKTPIRLTPGVHSIQANADFSKFGHKGKQNDFRFTLNAKAGVHYIVKAKPNASTVVAWIATSRGKRVTKKLVKDALANDLTETHVQPLAQ